jgi:hypothetical protein
MNPTTESVDNTTMPEARLERKRQINRLSAQRKRIREKHMMKVLTEKCSELVANRKILEMEREKLMSFLTIVKAKTVKEKQAVQAIAEINESKPSSVQDKSEVIDFVAKGLLELANSGFRKDDEDRRPNQTTFCPSSQTIGEERDDRMPPVEEKCSGDQTSQNVALHPAGESRDERGLGAVNCMDPALSQLFQLIQGMKAAEDSLKSGIQNSQNQVSQADIGGGMVVPCQTKQVKVDSPIIHQVIPHSPPPQTMYHSPSAGSFNPPSLSSPSSSSESGSGTVTIPKQPPLSSEQTNYLPDQYQIIANIMSLQRNHQGSSIQESTHKLPNGGNSAGNVGPMASHSYFSTMRRASDDIRSPEPMFPAKEVNMSQPAQQNQVISQDGFAQSQNHQNPSQNHCPSSNINHVPYPPNSNSVDPSQVAPNQILWALSILMGHLAQPQAVAPTASVMSNGYGTALSNGFQTQSNQPLLNSSGPNPGPIQPAPVSTSQVEFPVSPFAQVSSTVQVPEATVPSWAGLIPHHSTSNNPVINEEINQRAQGNNETQQIQQQQQQVQLQLLSALIMQQAASAIASGKI